MRSLHPKIALQLQDEQLMRLERHSYVNLINVVHAELQLIERMIEAPGKLRDNIQLAESASRAFRDSEVAQEHAQALSLFDESTVQAVSSAINASGDLGRSDDVREAVGILESVLADAQCRLHEVLARHGVARPTRSLSLEGIQCAITKAFDGRFSIGSLPEPPPGLPVGVMGTFGRLLQMLRDSVGASSDGGTAMYSLTIDKAPNQKLTRVLIEGPTGAIDFTPLGQNMRPSQLHEKIRDDAPHLRGALELYYFSLPNGSISLKQEELTVRIACVLGLTN